MHKTMTAALSRRGYDTLTEVQQAVTDPDLADADLLVSAQTGSGKTVGFGLAIAGTLLGDADTLPPAASPLALIVAPTRELAMQVMREVSWLYADADARVTSCVGGMDMRDERRALDRGAHIVVGTPGRLRDHIARGSLDLSAIRAIVLDEADEMLDLGFREDLEFMLGEAPDDRRTLLFSATVPPQIAKLAQTYQRDAVRVSTVGGRSQHADIAYQALRVAQSDAENAIVNVLRFHDAGNAIVFANTRATVARLTARLSNRGFQVVSLSGELSQTERTHALQAMRDGRARVCVATDVAARGIDLPNLDLVVHAELPSNAEGVLHRSGRTGRAGRKGISALIVPPKATRKAERLLQTARITAEWTTPPSADDILRADEARLLADPMWTDPITSDERAFAATLLDLHAPETIAAAFLRLHRTNHSAPEDLSPPDARPERKDRETFGPSAWIALSVGRNDRAEPRWLLPLLCRAGGLDKSQIGAIRVQPSETHVELLAAALPGFLSALGDGGELEKGVTARAMDAAPGHGQPRSDPPPAPTDRAPARTRDDKPRKPKPAKSDWHPSEPSKSKPRRDKPAPVDPTRDGGVKPMPPAKPAKFAKPKPQRPDAPKAQRPDGPKAKRPDAPKTKRPDAPKATQPDAPKPAQKSFRAGAADPSKRFERPGKPGGKPKPKGKRPSGNDVPRRKPR